ncbi:MAG: replication-relaxation family protein [Chloroflexi bacterium]|nr:replication-relaxation family protein [Chloroflexota bacterium]
MTAQDTGVARRLEVEVRRARPPLLTARDYAVLIDLVRFGALTLEQLTRHHFRSVNGCAQRLAALRSREYVTGERIFYRGPSAYMATARGARLADIGLRPGRLVPETAVHQLAVTDLADWCLAQQPSARWTTERELRHDAGQAWIDEQDQPSLLAHGLPHMPDGLLSEPDGRVAIELELSTKPRLAYERIFRWYAGATEYDRVRWFVRSERLRQRLTVLVRQHGLDDVMTCEPLPAVVQLPSWMPR